MLAESPYLSEEFEVGLRGHGGVLKVARFATETRPACGPSGTYLCPEVTLGMSEGVYLRKVPKLSH